MLDFTFSFVFCHTFVQVLGMDALLLARGYLMLVPEISHATGMLTDARLQSSFSIGVTDNSSKSSSLKTRLDNGQIPAYMQFYSSQ
jgi:hypothetical protein